MNKKVLESCGSIYKINGNDVKDWVNQATVLLLEDREKSEVERDACHVPKHALYHENNEDESSCSSADRFNHSLYVM